MTETKLQCHARRHMTASVFMTYDAILAMAKSSPTYDPSNGSGVIFYGRVSTIANHTNRSRKTEFDNIKILIRDGWLRPDGEQSRWKAGQWGTCRYSVCEHEEYLADYLTSCPALKYDPQTGKRIGKCGKLGEGLVRANERRRDELRRKNRTATQDCVTVSETVTRSCVTDGEKRLCHGR